MGMERPVLRWVNGWYSQDAPSSPHAPLVTRSFARPSRRILGAVALVVVCMVGLGVPQAMGASGTFSGTVTAGGTAVKNFSITVSSPGQITATLQWSTPSAALRLLLVDPTGTQVAKVVTTANPKTLNYNATLTGTYKVQVKATSGSSSFTVAVSYPGISVPSYAGQVGGGTAGRAEMYPSGVAVGPDGTVYIADTGNDQVAAYAPDGHQIWRDGVRGSKAIGNFNNPRDLAYLGGKLYVDDTGNNRVQVLSAANGVASAAWSYHFPSTLGISAGVDAHGNSIILVSEDTSNQVQVFTPSGTPECSFSGPSGTLSGPRDAATNAAGDVYVADYAHDRIVEFGPANAGSCSQTVIGGWGSHGSTNQQFLRPYGVDIDSSGNVYVADSVNSRIQEFDASGTYENTYGADFTAPGGDLHNVRRVAVVNGQVYAADLWGLHVDRFSAPGPTPAQSFPGTYATPPVGFFNEPSGITFDNAGNLYVADSVNQRMQQFAPGADGTDWPLGSATAWGARGWGQSDLNGFNWPRDISYAASSNTLWVSDTKNDRLLQFTTSGASAGTSIGSKSTMNWPYGVQADGTHLVVADTYKNQVEGLNNDGSAYWSAPVTSANGVPFNHPYDVAVANGVDYVADSGNKRIVELDSVTGAYVGSFGSANLHSPQGVAIEPVSGNVWVADTSYNRVVEFDSTGKYIQAFGKAGSGSGQFTHPTHLEVHVDAAGTAYLYVCDTYNDRIEILDLN